MTVKQLNNYWTGYFKALDEVEKIFIERLDKENPNWEFNIKNTTVELIFNKCIKELRGKC